VLGFDVPFTSLSKVCKMLGQSHFAQLNQHVLTSSNFNLQGHILSIGGVALRRVGGCGGHNML
jgi:hypothetical protein